MVITCATPKLRENILFDCKLLNMLGKSLCCEFTLIDNWLIYVSFLRLLLMDHTSPEFEGKN